MATYSLAVTMTAHETGTSGHYPIKAGSGTYSTTTTMWAKQNDTVTYVITEGDGSTVHYLDLGGDSNQDPTASGTGTFPVMSSGASWSHTLTSATNNAVLEWYYFGGTVGTGGGRKYSNRIITRRVAGTIAAGITSVNQGGTVAFSVSGMAGLPALDGSSNCFYIGIRNSSGTMIHTNNTAAGVSWDSTNNQLGKVHTADTSTTLTVGSTMTPGNYTAHLYHYNPARAEPFYDPDNQLSQASFTINAPTATVTGLELGDPYNSGTTLSTVVTRRVPETGTFSVTNGPANASISGAGSPQFQINGAGNYVTTGTIANGDHLNFKMTGPSGYSGSNTGTLTIGNASDSLVVTTAADPGGGGESSGGAGSAVGYGLAITNDTTVIFGSNLKSTHVLANAQSGSDLAAGASSGFIDMEAQGILKADNVASKVGIIIIAMDSGDENDYATWIITRDTTTGGGTGNAYGRWSVRNNSTNARSYRYLILRY